ncbi:lanthionine synthetase C family protein [Kitasatospora misakiensis]|uniref:Lanthionine synthetase C family protein n=1 Tax=Kitasatospora misakiensis TaxID=67330 RepID=A0ABW0X7K2_9ACTN
MTTWTAEAIVAETATRISAWTPAPEPGATPVGDLLGAAVLLCELSADDPAWRPAAHDKLTAAVHALQARPAEAATSGLFSGAAGLGLAVKQAADHHGGYRNALERLDTVLRGQLAGLLATGSATNARRRSALPVEYFDLVSGLTGLGRYFLAEPAAPDALGDVLRALVAVTEPVRTPDGQLPGWYSSLPEVGGPPRHVLSPGLAHGVAGPLALLSLSRQRGHRVPGQEAAVRRIADWLMSWAREDEAGPYWPSLITAAEERADPRPRVRPHRASWCYGAPGVARALQLAGLALGEESWTGRAVDAVHAVHRREGGLDGLFDAGLCHGLAGLARATALVAADASDPVLHREAEHVIDLIRAAYDPATAFGYPVYDPVRRQHRDSPGLLEGAGGVALTLHTHLAPAQARRAPWDAALLLS